MSPSFRRGAGRGGPKVRCERVSVRMEETESDEVWSLRGMVISSAAAVVVVVVVVVAVIVDIAGDEGGDGSRLDIGTPRSSASEAYKLSILMIIFVVVVVVVVVFLSCRRKQLLSQVDPQAQSRTLERTTTRRALYRNRKPQCEATNTRTVKKSKQRARKKERKGKKVVVGILHPKSIPLPSPPGRHLPYIH